MDYKAWQTGNVAIEVACRGKPSGLMATTAEWWAIVIDRQETVVFIKTARLKRLCKDKKVILGGDNMQSKMVLVPVKDLTSNRFLENI